MRKMSLSSAAAVLCSALGAHAQEGAAGRPRFFDRPIDFWGRGKTLETPREEPDDWAVAIRMPDGRIAVQALPAPLVAVLEDPSPEKVRAYFEWRLRRAVKILRAAEAIRAWRREPERGAVPGRLRITYFHRTGCPPCRAQSAILDAWLRARPEVEVRVLEFGERPEVWRAHGVRGTPSLLVEDPATGRSVFLEGLSTRERLEGALLEVGGRREEERP
jgi:hypothetical protein